MALVLDTGVLYAGLDRRDSEHERCRLLLAGTGERMVLPAPILVEVDYLLSSRGYGHLMLTVLDEIIKGVYHVEELDPLDYVRVAFLCEQYRDAEIGFVDAAVLAIVERLDEPKLATLDRRHFGLLRPRHVDALRLLPDV